MSESRAVADHRAKLNSRLLIDKSALPRSPPRKLKES